MSSRSVFTWVVTIAVLLHRIPLPLPEIFHALAHPPTGPSKLIIIDPGLNLAADNLGFDASQEFTLLTVTTGFVLLTLASHGMDQDLVQRMLTCRNGRKGAASVISGVLVGIPAVCIFLVVGLLLYVFYQRPDIMGAAAPTYSVASDQVFQTFAYQEMGGGLAGLFLAGLFAAGPAGINSGLNSMSSTFVSDIYRRGHPGRDEAHYLRIGRLGVVGSGVLLGIFGCICITIYDPKGSLLAFVLGVMGFAYAGLLGMFFTALFTRRGNAASVILGLFVGFGVVACFQLKIWQYWPGFKDLKIAFPWHLVAGTIAATLVCVAGKPRKQAVEQA
ncbi:MAG: hypothetical protein NTV94_18675 [Planctomycetota bacterium]|nr:hypothetical protein [Planctomycetota bacterium]